MARLRGLAVLLAAVIAAHVHTAHAGGWAERVLPAAEAEHALRAGRDVERVAAIDTLVRHTSRLRATPLLITALAGDQSTLVRVAAARALGAIGAADALAPLAAMRADGDLEERTAAVRALARLGGDGAVRELVACLGTDTEDLALEGLIEQGPSAVPALVRALRDAQSLAAAARALGAIGDRRATEPLVRSLAVEPSEVRAEIVRALRALGDERAVPALVARLGEPSPEVLVEVYGALGALGGPELGDVLRERARSEAPGRCAAIEALVQVDPVGSVDTLQSLAPRVPCALTSALHTTNPALAPLLAAALAVPAARAQAASALAELEGGAGLPALTAALREHDADTALLLALGVRRWGFRSDALSVLAAESGLRGLRLRALARDASVLSEARAALDDATDPVARAAGADALLWLDARTEHARLRDALLRETDADAWRHEALAARGLHTPVPLRVLLGRLDDAATAPEAAALLAPIVRTEHDPVARRALRHLLRAGAPRARAAAARALGEAGEPLAWHALVDALSDPNVDVRTASASALAMLAPESAESSVAFAARTEDDPHVRARVAEALRAIRGRSPRIPPRGRDSVRLRVSSETELAANVVADVHGADGTWLRLRPWPTGEVVVTELPAGVFDVRLVREAE